MAQLSPIAKVASKVGSLAKLARALGVSSPTAHEWKTEKRKVPAAHCKEVVRLSEGAVTLQELRPDDWRNYWPELDQAPQPASQQARP